MRNEKNPSSFWRIQKLTETTSTNDDVRRAAEAGETEGLVIHALQQTAGRGRHGRIWQSPEGNLYCSVLLRPVGMQNLGQYSFVASLALADTVQAFLPDAAVTLKWPNDVLANGKKISGILLEADEGFLITGMGLNVMHHPEDALYPSTSLKACGFSPVSFPRKRESSTRDSAYMSHAARVHGPLDPRFRGNDVEVLTVVLETLLDHLHRRIETIQKSGFAPIRAAWLEKAQKGRLTARLQADAVEGMFQTIDEQGHLILRLADGTERAIATGDVFFAPRE